MRCASSKNSKLVAGALPKFDSQAIANMKGLGFDSLVVKEDPPIGQNTVHVRHDALDMLTLIVWHGSDPPLVY